MGTGHWKGDRNVGLGYQVVLIDVEMVMLKQSSCRFCLEANLGAFPSCKVAR